MFQDLQYETPFKRGAFILALEQDFCTQAVLFSGTEKTQSFSAYLAPWNGLETHVLYTYIPQMNEGIPCHGSVDHMVISDVQI